MPAQDPNGGNIKESTLKKEGPSGEAATQQWHASGVSVWGDRVSPVFPPYLEAGVILFPDNKEMRDVLGRLCGPPEPAFLVCSGFWEKGLAACTCPLL